MALTGRRSEPPLSGRRGLVLGAGAVGLMGAMKLLAAGCETAIYSREPMGSRKAQLVDELGARYFSAVDTPVAMLPETLGRIDVVYEATGAAKVAFETLQILGANGAFVFTGIPGRKHALDMDPALLMRNLVLKNQLVLGTVNAGRDAFQAAVRDLSLFRTRFGRVLDKLIAGRHSLQEFPKLDLEELKGIKHVVAIDS